MQQIRQETQDYAETENRNRRQLRDRRGEDGRVDEILKRRHHREKVGEEGREVDKRRKAEGRQSNVDLFDRASTVAPTVEQMKHFDQVSASSLL